MWLILGLEGGLALAAPSFAELRHLPDDPARTAVLSPDGSALLHVDEDKRVHLRTFPQSSSTPPFAAPEDAPRVVPRFAYAHDPWVLVRRDDAWVAHRWTGTAWEEGTYPRDGHDGFPAGPGVRWSWEGSGKRWTVSQHVRGQDAPAVTWDVRMGRSDRTLPDVTGTLRAIGRARGRRVTYRPLQETWSLPPFFPGASPYPHTARLERRLPSWPLQLVGNTLYAIDQRGLEHAALVAFDVRTGERTLIHAPDRADVVLASWHPDTGVPDLAAEVRPVPTWTALDPALKADLAWVQGAVAGPLVALQRARGDRIWHMCGRSPHRGTQCVHADRDAHTLTPTLSSPPAAWAGPYPRTWPAVLETSDGLRLHNYLVLPPGEDRDRPTRPLPTVIRMHGGPYSRADYSYSPVRTFLASRGYAVLELNYRGSTRMGMSVMTGADGERGRATQRDVEEATAWLIEQGIADPDRIALMGHSFGGYATLLGLARTPDGYACGVALAPTAAWSYRWVVWALPRSLKQRAPYTVLDQIRAPLLLVHGTRDKVLPVGESRHVARVLERQGTPVRFLEVADSHSLQADATLELLYTEVDDFLAECLGAPDQ